ncbi:MAG: EscR/YscR/HrcR family type III secretion system export apparatus protein [Deltaproteobacteria bacterium]|nr:EscR/YscR/HrcR family type III secretion system export apparatus protein [Deltaproteobacteria bacterium]MBN2672255.1 EscR/YscR/HrcR family type III secretion system export apparatus protein [Deltaproteobacteria bacterium]
MTGPESNWMAHFGVLALMAVVPFIVVVGTSFAKVAVVLGITRNAIGGQSVIPVSVLTALSMVITIFIMGPVVDEMVQTRIPDTSPDDSEKESTFARAAAVYQAISPPLIRFLQKNTPREELDFFTALDSNKPDTDPSVRVLLLAFASNELVEAFALGFLVLVPFLLVDLLTANTLSALGMTNISVITVALPLKLLLFIAADGWHLLINALIVSYGAS